MLLAVVAAYHFSLWLAHPHSVFMPVSQHQLFEMTHTLRLNLLSVESFFQNRNSILKAEFHTPGGCQNWNLPTSR